ncbi:putative DNA binding domain-containing protein [Geomonas oryzisoli]|uniref:DNA binding domain-containing protein n=1 Tax=Geomonas oryzisoli TaxID=2847992 RepID=A0ABX8JEZ4_9BACT|nr:putative DNA binding domain-containing protein [Geomonas oryzisoli]
MTANRSTEYLISLVSEFRKLPQETEWLEFKVSKAAPEDVGQYLSALANSAVLAGKAFGYMVWGIDNATHDILGTDFSPMLARIGNEELENWLLHQLSPKIHFRFFEVEIEGKKVVVLEIGRAFRHPVQFQNQEYIRVGSYKKKLKDFPEKERELWRIFDHIPFENLVAGEELPGEDVLKLLDYPAYFDLLKLPLPESRDGVLQSLEADDLIQRTEAGRWNIMNLGAMLFAKRLDLFRALRRKAVRVIAYKDNSRIETIREQDGSKGYASGFEGLIGYINALLPSNEVIGKALRKTVPMYPELAVRELVANALIHQDFFVTGSGPMIEIFSDRMEISNPGIPLVQIDRFLDTPPRSRNEALASFLRRIGVCEERGSGVDKVVFQTECFQLPAPVFEVTGDNTRAVLFAHRTLTKMDKEDRVRACYLHACLKYVNREYLTNTSLRERFGIEPKNMAVASRLIKEAVAAGAIVPYDVTAAPKLMKYVPWWAAPTGGGS